MKFSLSWLCVLTKGVISPKIMRNQVSFLKQTPPQHEHEEEQNQLPESIAVMCIDLCCRRRSCTCARGGISSKCIPPQTKYIRP